MKPPSFFPHEFLMKIWWVVLFFLGSWGAYHHSIKTLDKEWDKLYESLEALKKEKKRSLLLQEDLKLQIKSHQDPLWIELTLLKGLGMVPEDQTKVFFKQRKEATE